MVPEQKCRQYPGRGTKEMTFVGDAGFLWENAPHHAAIKKKHDQRQCNGQPVATQDAGSKNKEHHAMRQAAGTEVKAVPGKQPDTDTGADVHQHQHGSCRTRVAV